MAKLIYSTITSLDGCTADTGGGFGWAAPDDEVHTFINNLERSVGTYLYGRRMYETMIFWETASAPDDSPVSRDYAAVWQAADKIIYSTTLQEVSSERTRIERRFEADAVRELKASASDDVTVGGPTLAAQALGAGLVDEIQLFVTPVIVGGGTTALPGGLRLDLELLDERQFSSGVVYLRYGTTSR